MCPRMLEIKWGKFICQMNYNCIIGIVIITMSIRIIEDIRREIILEIKMIMKSMITEIVIIIAT